jgi:hypothetical protein
MGRYSYLTRLALGRSPFQDADSTQHSQPQSPAPATSPTASDQADSDTYIQQYDSKSRPINPATELRSAQMRKAQNSILALVGVVEDREHSFRTQSLRSRFRREAQQRILKDEHERGEDLELALISARPVLTWWIDCSMQRIQLGVHDSRLTFTEILSHELRGVLGCHGLKGVISALYPGAAAFSLWIFGRWAWDWVVETGVNILSASLWNHQKGLSRRKQNRIQVLLQLLSDSLVLVGDACLLPLLYYSTAQQLGIAPAANPLLPPFRSLLPRSSAPMYRATWTSLFNVKYIGNLSPAILLLAHTYTVSDIDDDTPINPALTNFTYPTMNTSPKRATSLLDGGSYPDPFDHVLRSGYRMRCNILAWCGWRVRPEQRRFISTPESWLLGDEMVADSPRRVERDADGSTMKTTRSTSHRSTNLAHLPAKYLAVRIDELFIRLLLFPLTTAVYHAVATSYTASPVSPLLPQTTTLFRPQTLVWRSPIVWLRSSFTNPGPLRKLGIYACRVGLSFALRITFESVVFIGVWRLVRRFGVRLYGWRSKENEEQAGDIFGKEEGEEV